MDASFYPALKTYILSQPDLSVLTSGPGTDYGKIATLLNANASPQTLAWKNRMTPQEVDAASPWANFDSITQAGKRDSFLHAFLKYDRDFTSNPVRKWVTDVWGNATAGSDAEKILQAATENAKRVEVALGGNTKTTGTVTALARNYVGQVELSDIATIFNV